MGAWGTSLYSNDLACDIRGDYLDELKRGETNEEATLKLIKKNLCNMVDGEDEPLFWLHWRIHNGITVDCSKT